MLITVLIVNLMIALMISLYEYRRNKSKALACLGIMLLVPVVGIVIYFMDYILYKKELVGNGNYYFESGIENSNENDFYAGKIATLKPMYDVSRMGPGNDILLFGEKSLKRELVINILKRDADNYIEILKNALASSDSETSHYAAVGLIEIKRKITNSVIQISSNYKREPFNREVAYAYSDILSKYLNSKLLDEKMQSKYRTEYEKLLSEMIEKEIAIDKHYYEKANLEMSLKKYDNAKETIKLFLKRFPRNEKAYVLYLKYYFLRKDKQNFKGVVDEINSLRINLSNKNVELIKFWYKGTMEKRA